MYKLFGIRRVFLLLFIAIFFSSLAAQTYSYETITSNGQTYYRYKVKTGEGLYAISRTFNISINDILKSNPGVEAGLKNGQELLIPASSDAVLSTEKSVTDSPQPSADPNSTFRHTVARGETLYAISRMYNTTTDEVIRQNLGLTENITEGQTIVIPQQKALSPSGENYRYHTIIPKETLYSVSHTYSLKPEDLIAANSGLSVETFQIGKTIRVPLYQPQADFVSYENSQAAEIDADRLLVLNQSGETQRADVIRVGLLLPFRDKTDNQHFRLQEYYEGFLLAVEKMKTEGANIEVYVFEIGSRAKLESLLGTMEMESLHLLIGGMTDEQIRIMSEFSKKHDIKYIIPFSSKNNEVQNASNIFQVNTPQSYLYSKASDVFTEAFKKSNVVIVNIQGKSDKAEFISALKADLRRNNVRFREVSLSSNLSSEILPLLQTGGAENVIVPSSGDSGSLREITSALSLLHQSNQGIVTRLFGYPEWQTFNYDLCSLLHRYGAYFYTSFYVDDKDAETLRFIDNFKHWYGRELIKTHPKYGIFGYDTGLFFLNAIYRFGVNFEQRINQVPANTLQFAFNFERVNNWGGFINTGMYLIHYDQNNMTYKINKSR